MKTIIFVIALVLVNQVFAEGEKSTSEKKETSKKVAEKAKKKVKAPQKQTIHIGVKKNELPKEVLKAIKEIVNGKNQRFCRIVYGRPDDIDFANVQRKHEAPANEKEASYRVECEEGENMAFYYFNHKGDLLNRIIQRPIGAPPEEVNEVDDLKKK